jgi:hypothetical protein
VVLETPMTDRVLLYAFFFFPNDDCLGLRKKNDNMGGEFFVFVFAGVSS